MNKNELINNNFQLHVDECAVNPCQNNGTCVSTESDYSCECKDGFEGALTSHLINNSNNETCQRTQGFMETCCSGEFCEVAVDHCDPLPCMEGSTCRTINQTWHCFCKPGYLGRHCNLLPCDWLPCYGNLSCVNIEQENATRTSYR